MDTETAYLMATWWARQKGELTQHRRFYSQHLDRPGLDLLSEIEEGVNKALKHYLELVKTLDDWDETRESKLAYIDRLIEGQ